MYCEQCNTKVAQSIRICPKCGNRSFSESITTHSPIPPKTNNRTSRTNLKSQSSTIEPRPWVRLWARVIDYSLFGVFLGLSIGYLFPYSKINDSVLGVMVFVFWIFGEAFCMANFGNTPGKKLLKVSLTHNSGKPINFSNALTRAAQVYWRGLALGLPIVYIITGCVAYSKLMQNGVTTWDRDGGYVVSHQKIGMERIIMIFVLIFAPLAYLIWLGYQTEQHYLY